MQQRRPKPIACRKLSPPLRTTRLDRSRGPFLQNALDLFPVAPNHGCVNVVTRDLRIAREDSQSRPPSPAVSRRAVAKNRVRAGVFEKQIDQLFEFMCISIFGMCLE